MRVGETLGLGLRVSRDAFYVTQSASPRFTTLYFALTATQRRVLAGLAAPGALDGTVSGTARRIGVAASTYRTARASFVGSDLLHERFDHAGPTRRFAFVDPFFAAWLRGFVQA